MILVLAHVGVERLAKLIANASNGSLHTLQINQLVAKFVHDPVGKLAKRGLIDDPLAVLLQEPVVGVLSGYPCHPRIGRRLAAKDVAVLAGAEQWLESSADKEVIELGGGHAFTVDHLLVYAVDSILVRQAEHILQAFVQSGNGRLELAPRAAHLRLHQRLSVGRPELRRADVLVVADVWHGHDGVIPSLLAWRC